NANIHRGVHTLSQRSTDAYESVRGEIRSFLNARYDHEIIYVRGTTEAINLVAFCHGSRVLKPNTEVLLTEMEHHSNIVPWQMVCECSGAKLRVVPITDDGGLRMDAYADMLSDRTKIVAVTHISNALGTVNPVKQITEMAHAVGATVLIDGAQAVSHMPVDVQAIGCDFYAFSGHKTLGPTGIGVLYGRSDLLQSMPPYQGGGDMIETVTFEKTTYNQLPAKFEAGTPHIAGAIGLGAALRYLNAVGLQRVARYEADLLRYATERITEVPGLRLIGNAPDKAGILSFVMDVAHPHDIGTILDLHGVAIRTGHHCAMPLMRRLELPATARASLALYNTREDIDALIRGLHAVREVFH
ncbi:MAG: cysteine desulfurase, partial [Chthonomonadales bacterium]|nr:cysteine desulfurase [Chthonomonadales bacterium]